MIRSSASVPLSTVAADGADYAPIKRSGGRLSDLSAIGNNLISRSSSALPSPHRSARYRGSMIGPKLISPGQSAFHLSSSTSGGGTPGSARRRSTETSGSGAGLDYYWSNAAGVGPSSSSSSLAMSPSPSIGLVEAYSGGSSGGDRRKGLYRRSEASLRDLIAQEQRRAEGLADERAGGAVELESPSWSGESDYSSSHSLPAEGILAASSGRFSQGKPRPQPVNVWNTGEREAETAYDQTRQSMASTSTARSPRANDSPVDAHRTPLADQSGDRPDLRPPGFSYASDSLHATPIVSQTNFVRAQPSPSSYTPGSGRLDSSGVRGGGSPATGSAGASPSAVPGTGSEVVGEPQSAPPWQGEFGLGVGNVGDEADETVKGRGRDKRATLPAMPAEVVDLLNPEKRQRGTGSPQPPPRSALRAQLAGITSPLPNLAFDYNPSSVIHGTHSPLNISPPSRDRHRLSLSSTPTSSPPMSREGSVDHTAKLPSRLRDHTRSTDSIDSKGSINDLTELLGGAIDEIGLIDSRETPPPMIAADSRDKPRPNPLKLSTSFLAPAAVLELAGEGEEDRRPITPGSLPSRGESLSSGQGSSAAGSVPDLLLGTGMVPAPNPGMGSAVAQDLTHLPAIASSIPHHQRQTSTSTLHAPGSATSGGFSTRPWPAAMLFGHIKNMKHSGDRAKYYAKGINELASADSGLRDWCVISAHRIPPARVPLNRLQSNMTARSDFAPSIHIQPALPSTLPSRGQPSSHPRNVSSSSEFPMREDSYTAREISQRVIDPGDEPTSLPPNLPYPQLQQVRQGGMRNSPSVASMASMASTATGTTAVGSTGSAGNKRGFFSALRSKKDSGGLGPPTGQIPSGGGKKDVRGLPISNPERSSLSGPTPLGPRGPRLGGGSYTPDPDGPSRHSIDAATPYRGSLDGMRLTPPPSAGAGRASFDSNATQANQQRTGIGARLQQAAAAGNAVQEGEVRGMQDVLPHVDRGVLRAYLAKHGDQMSAITAYFEDEKRGAVRA